MKKNVKKILSGTAGAAMLLSSAVAQVATAQTGTEITVEEETTVFDKVADVQGEFSFDQNVTAPSDEVFSLFGTAVTGICATPSYALRSNVSDYYINVGGKITQAYTVNLKEQKAQSRIMLCSCATGAATANASITGVRLSDVLSLAEIAEDVNTITVRGSDGYGLKMPLKYTLDKGAMLVYQVGDKEIPSGTQFWVPETVAKYFTRDVVDIELTAEAEVPGVDQRAEELRAEVAIMNYTQGERFKVADIISFEGYADDCGDAIRAVEFSLDDGETWTAFETPNATADRWVYWHFDYTPTQAGTYKLSVRARTESGAVSPLASNVVFTVEAGQMLASK